MSRAAITVSQFARDLVRARVAASQTTPITILRGELGTLNPSTGIVGGLRTPVTVYSGMARIHAVAGEGDIAVGEGELNTRQVIISIPWNATPVPLQNDLVIVGNDDINDPDIEGEAYQVREVSGGSLFGDARRLSCVGFHGNRYWTGA